MLRRRLDGVDGVTGGHPLDQCGLAWVGSVDDRVVAGLVDGDRVSGGKDAKIDPFPSTALSRKSWTASR